MPKYIFLDNWVYSLLNDAEFERRLSAFLSHEGYTVLVTSLSFVELYNPNWEQAGEKDRMYKAANFLSKHPSVIVHPNKIYEAEIHSYPYPLASIPVELALRNISSEFRAPAVLAFLKGEEAFVQQGKSIQQWHDGYKQLKDGWLSDVENIIEHAIQTGYLKRDNKGNFIELPQLKEQFLLSLDFRMVEPNQIDSLLQKIVEKARSDTESHLTAIRLLSLCFWYAYINVDPASKMRRNGSDIGDFYHISLLPYCAAFTTDGSMCRMLKRITEPFVPTNCEVITRQKLEEILSNY